MKSPYTLKQVMEAHQLVSGTIQTIFDNELSFKKEVLRLPVHNWKPEEYSIERCHVAKIFRVTLKHDDCRERELYIDQNEVFDWIDSLNILNEQNWRNQYEY